MKPNNECPIRKFRKFSLNFLYTNDYIHIDSCRAQLNLCYTYKYYFEYKFCENTYSVPN